MSEVTPSTAEKNLQTTNDMTNAQVREVEFTLMFTQGIQSLIDALGITRLVPKAAGTVLKVLKATGTLGKGEVGEGEIIPLSKYTVAATPLKELTLHKWRKGTSAESIMNYGYNQAVTMTTDKMLRDVQKEIRTNLFAALDDRDASTAEGKTLQSALAQAWGQLEVLYEDMDDVQPVYFVNPEDIADYLSTASITMQNAFGMRYVEDFLGLGTVFTTPAVNKGTVFATAKSNLIGYYVPVNGADLGEAFSFTSDETGFVGIHEHANYDNMTAIDTVVAGIEFFPEYTAGVVKAQIKAVAAI